MPLCKNAMLRYRVIDRCLRVPGRLWTLEELRERCNEAMIAYAGCGISKRTIQNDIQFMRSSEPGFDAPIVVRERKYYTYDEVGFSIFKR